MSLEEARKKINSIDDQMIKLFTERMHAAAEVAKAKSEKDLPVFDERRENEVLNRVVEQTDEELQMYAKMFYVNLFNISKSYQKVLLAKHTALSSEIRKSIENMKMEFPQKAVVACPGIEGSYAQQAISKIFSLPSIMYFTGFESVFNAVEKGLCQYGILPIENSSTGTVSEVYDLMQKHHFHIVKSINLKVNHALLTKKPIELSQIKEILSHEQALNQCSEFLNKNSGIKIIKYPNTAMAAQHIAESDRTDIAAISSPECARLYGLNIVDTDIQNNQNNFTRFICITKDMELFAGASRISLMLSVDHSPGALYNMIGKVSSQGLNLCKIESRPVSGKTFDFIFYFDIDASVHSDKVLALLDDMAGSTEEFTFLGCYLC